MKCPVQAAAEANGAAPALTFEGRTWTWADAHHEVSAVVEALRAKGVRAGSHVTLQSWNQPSMAWTFFACGRLQATFVPINARLTAAEVARLPSISLSEGEPTLAGLFTSGTTGTPKLIELTQANFQAAAEANAQRLGGESTQRWLGTLPLFHIGGLAMLYRCAVYGASIALEAHFDAARACEALDEGVTHASFVPTMLERVLEVRGGKPFSGVKAVLIGGGPMTTATLRRARAAGLPVVQTYGLTEACSQVTTELLDDADGTSAGPPLPGLEVRIVDPDAAGVGEIEVRGPTVAKGRGPWLHTKDLGALDAKGRLKIFARRMDLILSGGENVYPAEVEAVLKEHPAIRDVAVAPRTDAEWGQVPVAVVVAEGVSDAELTAWTRERLASFKVPRAWVRVEAVPRNATGKIDRARLLALVTDIRP